MTKTTEPSDEALTEMPEVEPGRFERRPGRGHHATHDAGEVVVIDADVWAHFGSGEAVNAALRELIAARKSAPR